MKFVSLPKPRLTRLHLLSFFSLVSLILSLTIIWQTGHAQQQLSLADILIGLRSKKATLPERNKLLTDAVKERGITFALTPEIEKELENTGADKFLIDAIRSKSPIIKVSATPVPIPKSTPVQAATPPPTPVPTPTPADFYQKRASTSMSKGDFDSAVVDYNKFIELKPNDSSVYLNRGLAFFNKKSYDLAFADYNKSIELNPKDSTAYFNRGDSFEKTGDVKKALDDYQKAVDLDPNNVAAKTSLQRLQAEQAKALEEQKKKETPAVAETPKIPQMIELGQINDVALKLMVPVYPPVAQRMNIQGKVTVQVILDEEGKVTAVKATDGPAALRVTCEDAARRSKFKPTMVGNQAVKATGFVVYNFKAAN